MLIAWTRVHAIMHQRTCAREGLSDMLDERHVAARNGINFHRTAAILIAIFLQIRRLAMELPHGDRVTLDRDLTATVTCDPDHPPHLKSAIGRCRQSAEEPHDRGPIEPRSSRDRGAIEPRSHLFCGRIAPT